jgi:hypothetical protein
VVGIKALIAHRLGGNPISSPYNRVGVPCTKQRDFVGRRTHSGSLSILSLCPNTENILT